jgi:hypothetical protein
MHSSSGPTITVIQPSDGGRVLQFQLLKNNAGILLIGDYLTLRELHTLIHKVNEDSPAIRDKEGWFLGLAYDIRKAFEQQRRVLKADEHTPEIGMRLGVEQLWPVLLFQVRLLRQALAWIPHSKGDQALTYALEHVVETGLASAFSDGAGPIIAAWHDLNANRVDADENLHSRGGLFSAWSKVERKRYLAGLIQSFNPMYAVSYEYRLRGGTKNLVDPAEIDVWLGLEWPDPKW